MAQQLSGSCLCGRVRYEVFGQCQSFFLCHCSRCRRDTGSAHAANLFAYDAALTWTQGAREVKTYQQPKTLHVKSFCQHCGSPLPTLIPHLRGVAVPAGSLDSPVPIPPTAHIFMGSSAPWSQDLTLVPVDEKQPDSY